MRDKDQVGEAEVDCEGNDGGDEAGPDGADKVGDIAYEPDGEEGERDAFCGALLVVFDQLGDLGRSAGFVTVSRAGGVDG